MLKHSLIFYVFAVRGGFWLQGRSVNILDVWRRWLVINITVIRRHKGER